MEEYNERLFHFCYALTRPHIPRRHCGLSVVEDVFMTGPVGRQRRRRDVDKDDMTSEETWFPRCCYCCGH